MHTVTDSMGNDHYLTDYAVVALQNAKDARSAEAAFEKYASDVPRSCRASVWHAVDSVVLSST